MINRALLMDAIQTHIGTLEHCTHHPLLVITLEKRNGSTH